jgi:large subunit ribosomal protein L11
MPKQSIDIMVEGGKASAGPPLGPALGPMKVKVADVVAAINEKTRDLAGMKIPVKVTVDTETRSFEIEVGSPPVSALVKKELGLSKGSEEPGKKRIADLSEEQVKKISRQKFGSDADAFLNQVRGTCRSMGISVGKGAVTEEEIKHYEEMKQAEEAEKEAKEAKEGKEEAEKPEEAKPGAKKEKEED